MNLNRLLLALIGLFILTLGTIYNSHAVAQVMQNDSVKLELDQTEEAQPTPVIIRNIKKDIKKHQEIGYGSSGIEISQDTILFDNMTPTDPLKRDVSLLIHTHKISQNLYQYLSSPLINENNALFPPTSCDSGSCTVSEADIWINNLTFGLGVNCNKSSAKCPEDFRSGDYYRSISYEGFEKSASIMNLENSDLPNSLILEYKANSSPSQDPGNYKSQINYLLVPIF